jgi:hypothetical protein
VFFVKNKYWILIFGVIFAGCLLLMLLPGVYADLISTGMEKVLNRYAEENGLLTDAADEEQLTVDQTGEMGALALDRYLTGKEEQK